MKNLKVWSVNEWVGKLMEWVYGRRSQVVKRHEAGDDSTGKSSVLRLQAFFDKHFVFRYNSLTGVTEYRAKEGEACFRPVDERELNGLVVNARLSGVRCWGNAVPTWVLSNKVEAYNPFHRYMAELPPWDGMDRVTSLLQRVSDDAVWLHGGRCWLRGMAMQWMGVEAVHANALVPVLVSDEQGMGKSTFCRQLLPDGLRSYYVDNLNLAAGAYPERKLVKNGLINLDEFDKISEKRQPDLKNLLQMVSVPIYRGKRLGYVTERRLASFIATTNCRQVLTDPTGSRRFLCVEVTRYIDESPLEHKQLYAQLKAEVLSGERAYLTKEEEAEVQRHNRPFYRQTSLEDVFHQCFRQPESGEQGVWLSAAELFKVMTKCNSVALRGYSVLQMSRRLPALGFYPRHTRVGNLYHVVSRNASR